MRKLYFAGIGIVLLLAFSFWAKNANFNLKTMMEAPITKMGPVTTTTQSQTTVSPAVPIEIIITVTPYGFVPDVITIAPGTKITWVNKSGNDANISPANNNWPELNLGNFWNNGSVSLVFSKRGRYNYYNHLNPIQHGTIVVR